MKKETLKLIFENNIAPALMIEKEDAKLCNGMSENVAKRHREFSEMSEKQKVEEFKLGRI